MIAKLKRYSWRNELFQIQIRLPTKLSTSLPNWTSGISGGYRLVSTYDPPGYKTILKFEIWSFSDWGGGVIWTLWHFSFGGGRGILKLSDLDLDSLTIFFFSETLGFGLSDNFHGGGGGILKLLDLDSDNFHFQGGGGGFWNSE